MLSTVVHEHRCSLLDTLLLQLIMGKQGLCSLVISSILPDEISLYLGNNWQSNIPAVILFDQLKKKKKK